MMFWCFRRRNKSTWHQSLVEPQEQYKLKFSPLQSFQCLSVHQSSQTHRRFADLNLPGRIFLFLNGLPCKALLGALLLDLLHLPKLPRAQVPDDAVAFRHLVGNIILTCGSHCGSHRPDFALGEDAVGQPFCVLGAAGAKCQRGGKTCGNLSWPCVPLPLLHQSSGQIS